GVDQVGEDLARLVLDDGALGHRHLDVGAAPAVALLAHAVGAVLTTAERVVPERQQGRHVVVGDQPHVAAAAAVPAVGTTAGHVGLPTERHRAGAAVSALHMEAALVDELGHRRESRTDRSAWETRIVAHRPDHDPAGGGPTPDLTPRARQWAATMAGHGTGPVRHAHADTHADVGEVPIADREVREGREDDHLAPGATRADGAGFRAVEEEPDPWRTCFERDRDRIVHGTAFRRLAGKTQVFVFPDDHQRTRLTHALEVAQVATSIARACRLNVALAEAIALGHDCGHGPFGHASEDALAPFVEGGYDHATWGADVVLAPLNLCAETLDGIRNHSWSRPAPATPEGEVVSWADRIAYLCHDFEDAVLAGVVRPDDLPPIVAERCGRDRRQQLHA